jgi:class 3 adenylate cyclase
MSSTIFFTGHMIDRPGRASQRFPASLAKQVSDRIRVELAAAGATDGFASAACGADILFHEAMIARGGLAHVILPCAVASFRRDCVDIIPGADWAQRFDRILAQAHSVEVLGEQFASDNAAASECCSRVATGLARRRAAERGETPLVLALWDGRPGDALGGTYSSIQFCIRNGLQVRVMLDLEPGRSGETRELAPAALNTTSSIISTAISEEAAQEICAVVFADAVGFSKLGERNIPGFVKYYLTCAMMALQANRIVPLVRNTWGDGLYLVFGCMREAGIFAIDFRDRLHSGDYCAFGLPFAPSVRLAVHAGPLYRIYDPVIGAWSYVGSHVTRAARLEPSTDQGKVFASTAFSALAAAEGVTEFRCLPAGRRRLAKDAGEMEVFELVTGAAV